MHFLLQLVTLAEGQKKTTKELNEKGDSFQGLLLDLGINLQSSEKAEKVRVDGGDVGEKLWINQMKNNNTLVEHLRNINHPKNL